MKITRDQYNAALKIVKGYETQLENELYEIQAHHSTLKKYIPITKDTLLKDAGLTTRLRWSLQANNIDPNHKVETLADFTEHEFRRFRNIGDGSIKELKKICRLAGIELRK